MPAVFLTHRQDKAYFKKRLNGVNVIMFDFYYGENETVQMVYMPNIMVIQINYIIKYKTMVFWLIK